MGIKAGALALLAGTTLAGGARAQAAEGFELGLQGSAYRYNERFEGERVKDEGTFWGLAAAYGRTGGRWMFEADLESAAGSVDYRSDDGVRLDDVDQGVGRLQLLVGRRFAVGRATTLTAYSGIGARVLLDESGGRTAATGEAGYDREVSYGYVPAGASARWERGSGRALTVYAQHNAVVSGESRTELSDVDPSLPDVTLDFDGGRGWELGARWTAPLGRGRIGVQPFARWWDLDRSDGFTLELGDVRLELFEPPGRTRELGVKLTYGF